MVPPRLLCSKHLLGEHVECHMLLGCIKRGKSIDGFAKKGLIEPRSLFRRHDALVWEMTARGFKHNSPMERLDDLVERLKSLVRLSKVSLDKSYADLRERCEACDKKYRRFFVEGSADTA